MGEPTKGSKLGCSFRRLCRRRGTKLEKRRGSLTASGMGQSKSNLVYTPAKSSPPANGSASGTASGTGAKNIQVTTTSRNRLEGGVTSMVTLTQRDKTRKSRSISSLSKAFRKRKWRPKRRNSISASFNMNDRDIKVEFMNVNQATEEDLMTLPGVNRALARNIVNHRTLIGGYRRVDDLALVSGMGATKLDLIRNEICTFKRRNLSRASSKSPSIESLPSSSGSVRAYRFPKPVNLNTATIFDLMGVQGINQALAAKIINYRDKKGPFKYIDDLKHVGISYRHLGALRTFLTVNPSILDLSMEHNSESKSTVSQITATSVPTVINNGLTSHRRSSSVPPIIKEGIRAFSFDQDENILENEKTITSIPPRKLSSLEDMTEIFELMSLKSHRPTKDCPFDNCHKSDRLSYRIASWNLENLTEDKVTNPGVLEVITRTILENRLSLVAVQEICHTLALQKICDELNEPRLSRNRAWMKPRGSWTFVIDERALHFNKTSHQLGVLYNQDEIEDVTIPKSSETLSPIQNGSLWQFSVFNVNVKQSSWILINVLSTPLSQYTNGHAVDHQHESVGDLIQLLVKESGAHGGLLLGSFNSQNVEKGLGNLGELENISPAVDTARRNVPVGSLWITNSMKRVFTGQSARIEHGLSHLAIPNGWSWGGRATVSDPFWCSFYESPEVIQS